MGRKKSWLEAAALQRCRPQRRGACPEHTRRPLGAGLGAAWSAAAQGAARVGTREGLWNEVTPEPPGSAFPSKRKAVTRSRQWRPDCWVNSWEERQARESRPLVPALLCSQGDFWGSRAAPTRD